MVGKLMKKIENNTNEFVWSIELSRWCKNKKGLEQHEEDLKLFFENIFKNTRIPDRAYWGTTKSSVSLIAGGIYLGAYVHSGNDRGIWLLIDKELHPTKAVSYQPVKSTKSIKEKLTWLHSENLNPVKEINQDKIIWESYSRASQKVIYTPKGSSERKDFIEHKHRLSFFWSKSGMLEASIVENDLAEQILRSKALTKKERQKRLKNANAHPQKLIASTIMYNRNPDVIAEVLDRANGICELCGCTAPFLRDSDGTPYLEVHHKKPLAQGGTDTVENTIALCPNCHRQCHYGKNSLAVYKNK